MNPPDPNGQPRQPLDYAAKASARRTSAVGTLVKVLVAIAGAFLLFRLAMWRLFGNSDF